jgi:uncharacterized protein (TIGR02285 family)
MPFYPVRFFLMLMLLLFSLNIQAKEKLIWVTDDQADLENYLNDVHISVGTDTTKLVLKALMEFYEVDIQLAQLPRIDSLLTTLPNLCSPNRIKTEQREKQNVFSLHLNLFLSTRLYYLEKTSINQGVDTFDGLLNESGELLSLKALFEKHGNLILGASKGRSLGRQLDAEFAYIPEENIQYRAGSDRYQAIAKMFFKNRVDFIIEFPTELKRQLDIYPINIDIHSLAIADNAKYVLGHVACSKSELGERVIKKIDDILLELYQKAEFYQAHTRHLNEADLDVFNQYYKSVYQVAPPSTNPQKTNSEVHE